MIPKMALLEDIDIKPANFEKTLQTIEAFGGDKTSQASGNLRIKVWVDKGAGSVYKAGEKLTVYFKANRDCYLRLYHANAAGEISLLFPNKFTDDDFMKAFRVYSIPDEYSKFDFVISAPFGSEVIKAVASLKPFTEKRTTDFTKSVFSDLGNATKENIRDILSRATKSLPKKGVAENLYVFTTID